MDKFEDSVEYWRIVYDNFALHFPSLYERMVRWYPISEREIVVELDDNRRYVYNLVGDLLSRAYEEEDIDILDMEENYWREHFSRRIRKKLYNTATNQDMLSMRTGISETTLSKYVNGKVTPSAFNLYKIARALECSANELIF